MTERQAEIIGLIARGHTNKEIASQLGVSERAVKARASRLYRNFGVPNRAGLIARVMSSSAGRLDGNGHPAPELAFAAYHQAPFVAVVTRGSAHVFAFVNERFEKVTGLRSGSLIGRPMREALPGASDGWIERADAALRTGIAVADTGVPPWHADGITYRYVVQPLVDGQVGQGMLLYVGVPGPLA